VANFPCSLCGFLCFSVGQGKGGKKILGGINGKKGKCLLGKEIVVKLKNRRKERGKGERGKIIRERGRGRGKEKGRENSLSVVCVFGLWLDSVRGNFVCVFGLMFFL